MAEEGRVRPPYGGLTHCMDVDCRRPFSEEHGVYMHTNRETGKLVFFCGPCSRDAQMFDALKYPLIPL